MLQNPKERLIISEGFFWFNAGNFIFYTGIFFIFCIITPLLVKFDFDRELAYDAVTFLNVILYFSYGVTLYLEGKKQTEND